MRLVPVGLVAVVVGLLLGALGCTGEESGTVTTAPEAVGAPSPDASAAASSGAADAASPGERCRAEGGTVKSAGLGLLGCKMPGGHYSEIWDVPSDPTKVVTLGDYTPKWTTVAESPSPPLPAGRWVPKMLDDLDSAAYAINGRGEIAGTSDNYRGGGELHAVWWVNGRLRDLGTLRRTAGWWDYACGINDSGQIVGSALARPNSETRHAFLWVSGKMRDLGTLGGSESKACGINLRGEVVGVSDLKGGPSRAFLWSNGVMRDLGTLGGSDSEAVAINGRGQIVGSADSDERSNHAFLWENGKMRDLGALGGTHSAARDINDRGQIVGWAQARDGSKHAVLWENGRARDLGTRLDPRALNNRGQIVGACDSKERSGDVTSWTSSSACVWTEGRLFNLGTISDAAVATDINDRGQIVGFVTENCGGDCSELSYAYVWTPNQG